MFFQTVFFDIRNGDIIAIEPNKYINSKFAKARYCPDLPIGDIGFLYFPSRLPLSPETHRVHYPNKFTKAIIHDANGYPLYYPERAQIFNDISRKYSTIIVDMADSMGDNLIRASTVMAAMAFYPNHKFFCKVEPQYRDVMALCPDIEIFKDYKAHGLDPKSCGTVKLNGGLIADPRGTGYAKSALYGLFMNLPNAPYITRIVLPPDFADIHKPWATAAGLRPDGHNVTFHFRSKNWEERCWELSHANTLAKLIKDVYDCSIFYIGVDNDNQQINSNIINLAGQTTWMQTIYLLTQSAHIFCIDSSILHIARALGLKPVCLWGQLHPMQILGTAPGPLDIADNFHVSPTAIKQITPAQVFERAFPQLVEKKALVYDPVNDFSQHGTQKLIYDFFTQHPPKNRQLVDVGAWGKDMSNSYGLLKDGWSGLLIDANPARIPLMQSDFHGLDCEILHAGVGDRLDVLPFQLHHADTSNSFIPGWDSDDETGASIEVNVFPLADLLKERNFPIDFDLLSVDAEGMDEKIIKKLLSGSAYRPRIIVTEIKSHAPRFPYMARYGYKLFARTGESDKNNFLFIRP